MTSTATEITPTDTTVKATDKPATKAPVKAPVKPAATKTPVATDYTKVTTAKLESEAVKFVTAGNKAGFSLAGVLVALHTRSAWTEHEQSVSDYFSATIGVGESGFTMGKMARQELVKLMADAAPDAPISTLAQMTGASLRTIARDREQWELANPNRVNSHKPADDDQDDDNGTDAGDDTTDAKPAKTSKTRVQTVNVIEIIDALQDAQFITMIIAHASARLAELSTPAKAAA
jgi:hypothetical protein